MSVQNELKQVKKIIKQVTKLEVRGKVIERLNTKNVWEMLKNEFNFHFKKKGNGSSLEWVKLDDLNKFYVQNAFKSDEKPGRDKGGQITTGRIFLCRWS